MAMSPESSFVRFWNWLTLTDQRLQRLKDDGFTVGVAEVCPEPGQRIVEINLGYGQEYWVAPLGLFQVNKRPRYIEGGRLILDGGRPLATDAPLQQRGLSPEVLGPVKF
jgi:hypothetical protein